MPTKKKAPPPAPAADGGRRADGEEAAASVPLPFWHGALWEPLPLARWTQWATDENGDAPTGPASGTNGMAGTTGTNGMAGTTATRSGTAAGPSLNDVIRLERERLRALPERNLPMLRGLRDNIRRLIEEKLQPAHLRVLRVHHQRLVLEIQERIDELESGADLEAFERNIQPFVMAHAESLAAQEAEEAKGRQPPGGLSLPKAVIDAMVPSQQRLYRRMMVMIERGAGSGGAGGGGGGGGGSDWSDGGALRGAGHVVPEQLVRHMFSRLWVSTHAPASVHTLDHDLCHRCGVPMTRSTREQLLICGKCGFSMAYIDSTEAARTYGDDAEYNPNASHRFNHFQEFATRAQAREVKPVPRGVLAKVAVHLRDVEGVASAEEITLEKVVRAVGDLGAPLREYKKNVVQICAQLSGRWPVQLTAEQTFMARSIFFEILNAFELLFPSEKWFRNKFVMSVICHTMGWEEMLRTLDAIEGGGGAAAAAAAAVADGDLPSAAPAAPVPLAALRNVPRLEMEEAEMRMRAIFRHLGWQYRGPCVMMQQQGGAVGAGDGGDRAEESGAARALPFSHPTRT